MPSNPLKPSKAKASHRAWHGQRPGRHPGRFSGIKSARSPEDTCATSYEFDSYRSTRRINPMQELTGSTPKANLLLSTTDQLARKTTHSYDAIGNVLATVQLAGTTQSVSVNRLPG